MRTVRGRTDHVVVVGAGLGGLSAALRLTGAGRRVTLLEREAVPGGRAGLLSDRGYSFDTGPSVLTMPGLIADALACVGESLPDWLPTNLAIVPTEYKLTVAFVILVITLLVRPTGIFRGAST